MHASGTPSALGYRMPAEWERHAATWLVWPKDPNTFPRGVVEKVEQIYVTIILALAKGERVNILVDDIESEKRVSSMLGSVKSVFFYRIRTADVWIRDYGPIFIKNGGVAATKWIFNSWGNKYDDLKYDNQVGMSVAKSTGLRTFETGVVLEGGSIDVNGLGTCLTTEQCLLNRGRNPQLSKEEIERALIDHLGVPNIIWLKGGIEGDDTDGHVDDVARFVNEKTVVCAVAEDADDENYEILEGNCELLERAKDQDGGAISVVRIPIPREISSEQGRLPASYANFYIANAAVLVPTFNDSNDENVLQTFRALFPRREVVGINCESLVYGLGAIHCVTQQQPYPG